MAAGQDKQELLEEEAEHRSAPSGKVIDKAIMKEADATRCTFNGEVAADAMVFVGLTVVISR